VASITTPKAGVQRLWSRPTRRAKWRRRSGLVGLLFIWPALLLYLVFSVYPILRTVQISFTNWDGLSNHYDYVGWANYAKAFTDSIWWQSLWHGVFFSVMALILMNGLGLFLAIIVDGTKRGQTIYRALFYLPPVLSGVVVALIFKWIYEPYGGPLNAALQSVGLTSLTHAWLGDSATAIWCVSLASIWAGVGYPFLLFLAGLQGVPQELYEAAQLDGANAWQQFRHVTVPFLIPVGAIVSILTILGAMQLFNIVMAMTGGGPGYATEVPVLHIYREAFQATHFGYATALSMIFGAILFAVSIIQLQLSRRFGVRAS
jgi:raffinose/stachyose/melibiose transport system permease protein